MTLPVRCMHDRYTPSRPILSDDIFNGQLTRFGLTELKTPASSSSKRALTDGVAVLWIDRQQDGSVIATSDECIDVSRILAAIEECFSITWGLDDF